MPQTTAIRVPRPSNGSGMLPAPAPLPSLGGPPLGATGGVQMTAGDVWRVIRGNMWLIITIMILSLIAGFGLYKYLMKYHASYTARGYVQIQAKTVVYDPLKPQTTDLNEQMLSIHQRTQAQLLSNEALFSQLLQKPDTALRETNWFKQFIGKDGKPDIPAAKEALAEDLSVRPIPESVLVEIAMSYSNPKDTRIIVEDIVTEHLEDQRRDSNTKQQSRSTTLNQLRSKHEFRLRTLSTDLRQKAVQLSIGGASGQPGRISAKELELSELIKQKFEIQTEVAKAKGELATVQEQVQNGIDPPAASELIDRDPDVNFFKQQLNAIDMQLALETSGTDHKSMKSLQRSREVAEQKLEEKRKDVAANVKVGLQETLEAEVSHAETELKTVLEKIAATQGELGDLTYETANYLTLKDEEETTRELMKEIDQELAAITQAQTQADLSGISWARHPETPDLPSSPKIGFTMGAVLMAGLCLSLGIAFLRELLDTSVRSPRDIARVGQLNLLGMIPHESDDPQSAGSPLPLVIAHAPHSMLAEQFRQVRTRLQHAAQLESTRSILVTSPSPGDGKSVVATNLAVGLALNGRRILLVDANFRRPELHKIFGIANDNGFAGVLASSDSFAMAVQPTQIPNLDVLPSGAKPANSTELLESALLT
ncbi:MAG: hypothetical protein H0T11_05115, partial [Chthoniobacterales bacterium]|nr:hypothetical protein [Chthoniobacterales bacterium]